MIQLVVFYVAALTLYFPPAVATPPSDVITAGATLGLVIFAAATLWVNRDLISATKKQADATVKQADATAELVKLTADTVAAQQANMEAELIAGLVFYARESSAFSATGTIFFGTPSITPPVIWVRCKPTDAGATLFIQLDIQVRNRSSADDGITSARLTLHRVGQDAVTGFAQRRRGQHFSGENVRANSLVTLDIQFEFDAVNHNQYPEWTYSADTSYDLEVATMRGPALHIQVQPAAFTGAGADGDPVTV